MKRLILGVAALALCGLVFAATRQEGQQPSKPQKEHEWLKNFEGSWDAAGKFEMNGQAMTSKGAATVKMACNGFWLLMDYKGEMMKQEFEGHGFIGFDPWKKKFVSAWIDSMAPMLDTPEGAYDEKANTLTLSSEMPDPQSGKKVKWTSVYTVKDKDLWTLQFNADGKETGSIEFKRKK